MIFIRSLALRLLLYYVLCFSLFVLYGLSHFYRDPGSAFYDSARAYERQYSALRLRQVEQFRNAIELREDKVSTPEQVQRPRPEICVTMTTVFRPGLDRQYVEDAVLSMLDRITVQERAMLHINLLFTDSNATEHPSWHQSWLRTVLDNVWNYRDEASSISSELHSRPETSTIPFIKTKAIMDYTLALEKCLNDTDAPYIAAFEDDILFAAGWVAPSLRALKSADRFIQKRANSLWRASGHAQDWIYVRIFNQERSTGWASRKIGDNHELAIMFAIDVMVGLAIWFLRWRKVISSHGLDDASLAIILCFIIPGSVVTFFQAGKASLLPPRPGLAVENFGCCSQALIFNRRHVAELVTYLRDFAMQEADGRSKHVNYDLRTRDFANKNGLDRLALYPMQVQHIGIESALGTSQHEAQSVWSMAFEYLRDHDVMARHDKAMEELFGREWRLGYQTS